MTTPAAIEVNHISKIYRLYPSRQSRMIEMVHPLRKKMHRRFQALNDINFSVQKGEVVGLIGQNGSGKSTILKILSSVITPTSGSFTCNGRVTSLLELGGGFDMNLTGIENVYFIGAIQGYRKKQMEERMDQILEFAEIGDYANQPVKNYSSGMYVRLAFSININIDPEILIIDEALAVGDMRFQQKCFRKIREFKDLGKTIIICSHSMGAIRDFCTRTIWLNHGRLMADGEPKLVTDQFRDFMAQQDMAKAAERMAQHANLSSSAIASLKLGHPFNKYRWKDMKSVISSGENDFIIHYATLINDETGENPKLFRGGETIRIGIIAELKSDINRPDIRITLNGQFGTSVWMVYLTHFKPIVRYKKDQPVCISVRIKMPPMGNGLYSLSFNTVDLSGGDLKLIRAYHDAIVFEVAGDEILYKLGTLLVVKDVEIAAKVL